SLSVPSNRTVTVAYATSDDTAHAPLDYPSASGIVTFGPGQTTQTLVLAVKSDRIDELDELFCVDLSTPTGGAIVNDDESMVTILDDDTASFTVSDLAVTEGNAGAVNAVFTVSLSNPSDRFITVEYF